MRAASTASTPTASMSNEDESISAKPDINVTPEDKFPAPLSLILRKRACNPSTPSTDIPNPHDPLALLCAENALLRQQNAQLFAAHDNSLRLCSAYETQLQKHRAHPRVLEAELAKKAPSALLWKTAALKAYYGLLGVRDGRVAELEGLLGDKCIEDLEARLRNEGRLVVEARGGAGE
jgi:hypothetical protein